MSERLWAPWRDAYVSAPRSETTGCIFCEKAAEHRDAENHIVYRAEQTFVMLNAFPYSPGHLLIAPYAHVGDLAETWPETAGEMMRVAQRCERALRAAMNPSGFNLGMNLGAAAGAGVTDHVHLHIVPRWTGDTNFMTVLADVRVIPQALDHTYAQLRRQFEALE